MSDPLLLTEGEAARRLLMSARSLHDLRQAGQIRYVAITKRKIAYRPEDLEAYVLRQLRQNTPPAAPSHSLRVRTSGCRSPSPGVLDFEAIRARRAKERAAARQ